MSLSVSDYFNSGVIDMNNTLEQIRRWFVSNKLTLNVNKTVYMFFNVIQINIPKTRYKNRRYSSKKADSHKYLGVTSDSNLKWYYHSKPLAKKTQYLQFKFL